MPQTIIFKIHGLDGRESVNVIEENIKGLPGVLSAKVDFHTRQATVKHDSKKIKENEIFEAVKVSGDYKIDGVARTSENAVSSMSVVESAVASSATSPVNFPIQNPFVLGLLSGLALVSVIINILLGVLLYKSFSGNSFASASAKVIAQVNNPPTLSAPPTAQAAPLPQPAGAPQSFTITKSDHVRGSFDAPITLVEFSDFECPYCGRHYPTLKSLLSDYNGKVRLIYKHFPLSFHPNSLKASEASECASEQGKFWEYHDKLFDNQQAGFSIDNFKQWAKDLGLDSNKFDACLDTDKSKAKIQAEEQEGQTKGVTGTPATFVNGQLVSGALPAATFKQIIDGLLK